MADLEKVVWRARAHSSYLVHAFEEDLDSCVFEIHPIKFEDAASFRSVLCSLLRLGCTARHLEWVLHVHGMRLKEKT